jgi:hypothetical protein
VVTDLGEEAERRRDKDAPAKSPGTELPSPQADAAEELKSGFFSDAVTLSTTVRKLREAQGSGDVGGLAVRRVDGRIFLMRPGIIVESAVLDMDSEVLTKKLVRIEAFSTEYFTLLQKPGLTKVLALGDSLLFLDGDRVVQILPAAAETKTEDR